MKCKLDDNVGDRGQRYEVRFFDRRDGAERIMGWTEQADGGKLLKAAKLWPTARDPFVVDRRRNDGK